MGFLLLSLVSREQEEPEPLFLWVPQKWWLCQASQAVSQVPSSEAADQTSRDSEVGRPSECQLQGDTEMSGGLGPQRLEPDNAAERAETQIGPLKLAAQQQQITSCQSSVLPGLADKAGPDQATAPALCPFSALTLSQQLLSTSVCLASRT